MKRVMVLMLCVVMIFVSIPMEGIAQTVSDNGITEEQAIDFAGESAIEENTTVSENEIGEVDIQPEEDEFVPDVEEEILEEEEVEGQTEKEELALAGSIDEDYELTEKELFMKCPRYLNNQATEQYIDKCWLRAQSAMDDVSQVETIVASYMEGLKSGMNYIIKEVASGCGITDSNYDDYNRKVAADVLREYMGIEERTLETTKDTAKKFKIVKGVYDLGFPASKAQYAKNLEEACEHLTLETIQDITDSAYDKIKHSSKYLSYAKEGIDITVFITEMFLMQEVELSALDELIAMQQPGNDLYDGLVSLQRELNQSMTDRFLGVYCTDKAIEKIGDYCKDNAVKGLTELAGIASTGATFLAKIIVKGIVLIYEQIGVSASEIIEATLYENYAMQADHVYNQLLTKFIKGEATNAEIDDLKRAFDFRITCLKLWMEKAQKCTKDKNKQASLEQWSESLGTQINSDVYIRNCLRKASEDIISGKLVLTSSGSTEKTEDGTVLDENYDSTESIAARFRTIQNQYKPECGQTWNGNYGGAYQCFGFARMVFNKLFDRDMPSAYRGEARYEYATEQNVLIVGQLQETQVTQEKVKEMLQAGKLGDVIQAYGALYGQHTMIFVSVDDAGVTVYDCNTNLSGNDAPCTIHQWKITWAQWVSFYGTGTAESRNGISLYRASNYATVHGDGSDMFYDDSVNFEIDTEGTLIKYHGWQEHVVIPDTVKKIGDSAFAYNETMRTVDIPYSVVEIGRLAFSYCKKLESVIIPDSVTAMGTFIFNESRQLNYVRLPSTMQEIPGWMFAYCDSLQTISLPNTLKKIGERAFNSSGISEIEIPEGVQVIEQGAFGACHELKEIFIPKNVSDLEYKTYIDMGEKSYGHGPFWACCSLAKIEVDKENPKYCSVDGNLYNKDMTVLYQYGVAKNRDEFTVPSTVKIIWGYSFQSSPDLVTETGEVKKVIISYGVEEIGDYAFEGCDSLAFVDIPNSVTRIGRSAFEYCGLFAEEKLCINIPASVKYIGDNAFKMSEIEKIDVDESNVEYKSIEGVLFNKAGTRLICVPCLYPKTKYNVPDGTKEIGYGACSFQTRNNLEEIVVGKTVEKIAGDAFYDCRALEKIYILNSACEIYDSEDTINDEEEGWMEDEDGNEYWGKVFTTIYGLPNSTAEAYAKKYNRPFVAAKVANVVAPTCQGEGYTNYKFDGIDEVFQGNFVGKSGHQYVNGKCVTCGVLDPNYNANNSQQQNEPIKITKLKLSGISKQIAAGKKITLTPSVTPKNATNQALSWKTSNKKYATVSKKGVVTLKKAGIGKTVTITATANDGSKKKATYKIKIMKHVVKYVKLKASAKTIKAGKKLTVKATVKTSGKNVNKKLKWTSSNTKYATVTSKGVVKAKKAGKGKRVTITARATDGSNKKASIKLKIK